MSPFFRMGGATLQANCVSGERRAQHGDEMNPAWDGWELSGTIGTPAARISSMTALSSMPAVAAPLGKTIAFSSRAEDR